MEIEDFVEPEIAVTAAVAAAIFSPRARKVMRKGLVYGIAGALAAGDMVTSFARSVGQGVQHAGEATAQAAQDTFEEAREMRQEQEETSETKATPTSRRKAGTKSESARATANAGGQ